MAITQRHSLHDFSRFAYRCGAIMMLVSCAIGTPSSARAQGPSTPSVSPYARYTPFGCSFLPSRVSGAADANLRLTWFDRWPETAATHAEDSVVRAAAHRTSVAALRTCLTPHTVATTSPLQLLGLGLAWLAADDDAKAAEAFDAALVHARRTSVMEEGRILSKLIKEYLAAEPYRIVAAQAYMRRLDALGPTVIGYRLTAHNELYAAASARDTLPLMAEHAEEGIRLCKMLKGDALHQWVQACIMANYNRSDFDGRRGNFTDAVRRLESAMDAFGPIDSNLAGAILGEGLWKWSQCGKPVRPLQVAHIYRKGQAAPDNNVTWPEKGKVAIFHRVNRDVSYIPQSIAAFKFDQQVSAKFGAAVDLILLVEAVDFDINAQKLITTAADATLERDFFHEYLKMPVPLYIYERKVTGKQPDGRLIRSGDPNPEGFLVFVDKKGIVRNIDTGSIPRRMHLIEEMLREP